MTEYKVENHVSTFLPEHSNWKMVWNDEFDGNKLDETKWGFRDYFWGKNLRLLPMKEYMLTGKVICI